MSQYILVRGARQLITMHGSPGPRRGAALDSLSIIQDGSLLIKDGVITHVGHTRRVENLKEAREAIEIDVHGSVVMPGLIDAGMRLSLSGARPSGIERPQRLSEFYDQSLELLRSCLHHGTLHAEVRASADAGDFRSELSVLRRLAKIGDKPVGMVRSWRLSRIPEADEEVEEFAGILFRLVRRGLVTFVEVPASDSTSISDAFLAALSQADVRVKLAWTSGPGEGLAEIVRKLAPISVSCSNLQSQTEANALACSDALMVFSSKYDPVGANSAAVRHFVQSNGAIALASGYDARESPGYSMLMAISLAVVRGDLSMEQAISAATINAACAIGRDHLAGTIEVGKRADLLMLTLSDYKEIPRQFGINHVGMVIRDGEIVLNRSRWKIGAHEPSNGRVRAQHV